MPDAPFDDSFDARTTIAEFIAAHPGTDRVFMVRGLAACCEGKATLAEGAAIAGIPLEELRAELAAAIGAPSGERPAPTADPELVYLAHGATRRRREGLQLTPDSIVADVLEAWPAALPILTDLGFHPLTNPLLRRTLARTVTLSQACALLGIALELVMDRLQPVTQEER